MGGHEAVVCFHLTTEPNAYLSNWYPSEFHLDGEQYRCAEQYIMAEKARMFGDVKCEAAIMCAEGPGEMQKLGRSVAGYDDDVWAGARQLVARKALLAKFRQNALLRERLVETGSAIIAECSRKDRIWGIGLGMNDPARFGVASWPGRNLLGFALMLVREELREAYLEAEPKTPLLHAFAERLYHAAEMAGEQGIVTAISLEEMRSFGLVMDCGKSYVDCFGLHLGDLAELRRAANRIDDAYVLGSGIFSQWRYFTHWAGCPMEDEDVEWFALAGRLLARLTDSDS